MRQRKDMQTGDWNPDPSCGEIATPVYCQLETPVSQKVHFVFIQVILNSSLH